MNIRLLGPGDLPFCEELRRVAGWNQRAEDWERFLRLSPEGCFVAEQGGQPAGTVTTIRYGWEMGWIGMLLVHPDWRGRGVGTALLDRAIACLQEQRVRSIKLDATSQGEPLYARKGFRPEFRLTRWERVGTFAGGFSAKEAAGESMQSFDLPHLVELDRAAFGVEREKLLGDLFQQASAAVVYREGGKVQGGGMLRAGARAMYLGPVAATSELIARGLIHRLMASAQGRELFWDLPDQGSLDPAEWGFRPQRVLTRMSLGASILPARPETYYALADPSCG